MKEKVEVSISKMDKLSMCRICLVEDVKMCLINAKLQELYERLTKTPFVTNDKKPVQVCYLCHARLQNCYRLQAACLKSEEFLNKVIADVKLNEMVLQDLNTLKTVHPLVLTSYVPSTIKDPEDDKIKDHDFKLEPLEIIPDVQIKQELFEDDSLNVAVDIKSEGTYKNYDVHTEECDLLDNGQTELQHGVYRKIDKIVPERTDLEHFKLDNSFTNEAVNIIKPEVTVEEEDICPEDVDMSYNRYIMQNTELEHVMHIKTEKICLERIDVEQFNIGAPVTKKARLAKEDTQSKILIKPEPEVSVKQNTNDAQNNILSKPETAIEENSNINKKIHIVEKTAKVMDKNIVKQISMSITKKQKANTLSSVHINEKPHTCEVCGKCYSHKCNLIKHSRKHTGVKPYTCDICDKNFSQLSTLRTHTRIHTGVKPYTCNICDKNFSHLSSLRTHTHVHTGVKPFKCNMCDKSFSQRTNLIAHTSIHTGVKPFKCDMCDKSFSLKSGLIKHTRIHTGVKPFTCDTCDKSFNHKMSLITHTRIHTGVKPFQCDMCDKSFSQKSVLRTHTRIHTGVKPYTCDICDKNFCDLGNLRSHTRIHTGVRPFKCDVCDKSFSHRSSLTTHTRIHTAVKPYKCDICDRSFSDKNYLRGHLRIHRC